MTARAVIFDIGNVLLEWNPERFYDRVIGAERRQAFFAQAGVEEMNRRVDMGHPFTETIYSHADATPGWRDEIRMWHDHWIEMASPAIDRSVRLMASLQARGVPVFSLTNFGVESYELATGYYPFLKAFDRDFISGHMKVMKPDPQIYEMVEEATGLSGDALIFTDDRHENVEAAAARGWRTHLFTCPQGWADRLVAEGLLTMEDAA